MYRSWLATSHVLCSSKQGRGLAGPGLWTGKVWAVGSAQHGHRLGETHFSHPTVHSDTCLLSSPRGKGD